MSRKVSFLVAVTVCCTVLCVGRLSAGIFDKQNEAERLYGSGVHAFFDGDFQEAVKLLAKVEELGSEDPRPYFFLGLAQRRLKLDDEADETFKKAAKFEWEGRSAADYKVSDALRRIQGKERLHIEKFRQQAKLDWEKTDDLRQQIRYGQEKDKDRSILAQLATPSELPRPKQQPFVGAAPFGARSVDPFRDPDGTDDDKLILADDVAPTVRPTVSPPTKPATEDDDDLFGTSGDEMDEDDDDLFGTSGGEMDADDADSRSLFSLDEGENDEPKKDAKEDEADDEGSDPFNMSSDNEEDDDDKDDDEEDDTDDDGDDPFKS